MTERLLLCERDVTGWIGFAVTCGSQLALNKPMAQARFQLEIDGAPLWSGCNSAAAPNISASIGNAFVAGRLALYAYPYAGPAELLYGRIDP